MLYTKSSDFKKKVEKPTLAVDDEVEFLVGDISHTGTVCGDNLSLWYLSFLCPNDLVFGELNISKKSFTKKILGYEEVCGIWPYCKTLQDLTKLTCALLKECEKYNAKLDAADATVVSAEVAGIVEEDISLAPKGTLENPWYTADIYVPDGPARVPGQVFRLMNGCMFVCIKGKDA